MGGVGLDLDGVFKGLDSDITRARSRAKDGDCADGDLDAWHNCCNEEGIPTRHVAPDLKAKGGDIFVGISIIIIVVIVCAFEMGTARAFRVGTVDLAVPNIYFPLRCVLLV